ncbi:uncharacterized protein LOC115628022 [Scaptodrosophila lebanonensis]|uniref:Uncharacterized protein LOC115628022 n=1 Tax=Drosophila lebanonensis TaxID=7225 RepID=A0A6J2TXC6_DROLE|nr:uncharacterized protein LOC115628022 [Scaptodrosophila lebanonensis]XP_030379814.1 uncharacterized protein LOC115628022 [Scaptodrosophila lebanonensis]XP_030379815.1 uncharacterized protein LOC115628022 [Scaptodrosophila lebanonensis]
MQIIGFNLSFLTKMLCNRILNKYVQIDILVILICLTHGNGNFLNARSRDYASQRNTDTENGVKGVDGAPTAGNGLVEGSDVSAVGEVFVPKTFPLSSQEPTCEQLRAMWIFSKRQSRAAEITNEIPTYRDPFTYNVWEPLYSNSRTMGSLRMGTRERSRSPVFGRVVSREPIVPQRVSYGQRQRLVDGGGMTRFYGAETRPSNGPSSRRSTQNRYVGGPNSSVTTSNSGGNPNSVAVQGSFQKLKELIWTERAKELTQQRRAEELAARAAVLKEITNGQNIQSSYKPPFLSKSDSILMDENRSPDGSVGQYMDDGRVPIADGQAFGPNGKNEHRNGGARASARSYSSRMGHASAAGNIFSGNSAAGQSGRAARIKLPATGFNSGSELSDRDQAVIGIPRTYPLRQSHFRERNRSLLKQHSPSDYFQRDARNLNGLHIDGAKLNGNYLSPFNPIPIEYNMRANGPLYVREDFGDEEKSGDVGVVSPPQQLKSDQFGFDFYDYNGY